MERNESAFVLSVDVGAVFQEKLGDFDVVVAGREMERSRIASLSVATIHVLRSHQLLHFCQISCVLGKGARRWNDDDFAGRKSIIVYGSEIGKKVIVFEGSAAENRWAK